MFLAKHWFDITAGSNGNDQGQGGGVAQGLGGWQGGGGGGGSGQFRTPTPAAWARGPAGAGGGSNFVVVWGVSLFHSEHFEYAQVRGVQSPCTAHKWGGMGGKPSVPRSTEAKKILGTAGAQVGCSSLFNVVFTVWAGESSPTRKPPPPPLGDQQQEGTHTSSCMLPTNPPQAAMDNAQSLRTEVPQGQTSVPLKRRLGVGTAL